MSTTRSVCVILGSNSGKNPAYLESAKQLGVEIAKRKIKLVYGGSRLGLMGVLADTVLQYGGEVIGVITKSLHEIEGHPGLTKMHIVESMQERKLMMAHLSDGCIALPGGLGTLEEIFEFWNSIKLGIYQHPLALLNVDNYFNKLIDFVQQAVEQEFLKKEHVSQLVINNDPKKLLNTMFNTTDLVENKELNRKTNMALFANRV